MPTAGPTIGPLAAVPDVTDLRLLATRDGVMLRFSGLHQHYARIVGTRSASARRTAYSSIRMG